MSRSSDSDECVPLKKRKGVINEAAYRRNVIRNSRVRGIAYQAYCGKEVPSKDQKTYLCRCASKCYCNISEDDRKELWNSFYNLENKNTQDVFLQSFIEKRPPKRRRKERVDEEAPSESLDTRLSNKSKSYFFTYNIKIDGELRPVCKNTFMALYGVTPERVRRLCKLLVQSKTPKDLRGLNRSGNAISGDICTEIHNQISKFEVKETHYSGKLKKYLDARLNIKIMHEMFLKEHPDYVADVKYSFYRTYFHDNFDYSFGRPQVDVCSKCESFSAKMKDATLSDNAKRKLAAELIIHKRRAKKFYDALKEAHANKDNDTVAIAIDYMQNQPLPLIPVQEVFYLRQIWVNVFCIHDLKTDKANLYLYHEGIANKTPDEVCSFLWHYIQTLPPTVTKLLLFSDGAAGQNKNHTVVRFLLNLCDSGRFKAIRHFFPVRGHSFLPCDRDFGALKRRLRKTDRIYTPQQYGELFSEASKSERFTIHHATTDDILSFKAWWPPHYKKTAFSDDTMGRGIPKNQKKSFMISTFKEFEYNSNEKGKVVCKEFISGLVESTFSLGKTKTAPALPSAKAYPAGHVRINEKKIQDVKKLKDYVVGYEAFYDEILNWPTISSNNVSTHDHDFQDE